MDEDKSLQSKVTEVIFLTSCSEDLAAMTLHDFNNDVASTVDYLLDTGGQQLQTVTARKRNPRKSTLHPQELTDIDQEDRADANTSPPGAEYNKSEKKVLSSVNRRGSSVRPYRGRSTGLGQRSKGSGSSKYREDRENVENTEDNETDKKPMRRSRSEKTRRNNGELHDNDPHSTSERNEEVYFEHRGNQRKTRGGPFGRNRRPEEPTEVGIDHFQISDAAEEKLTGSPSTRLVRFQSRGRRGGRGRFYTERGGFRGYSRGGRVFTRRAQASAGDKARSKEYAHENGGSSGEHDGWDLNEGYELAASNTHQTEGVVWSGEPLVFTNSSATAQCVDQLIEEGPSLLSQYVPRPPNADSKVFSSGHAFDMKQHFSQDKIETENFDWSTANDYQSHPTGDSVQKATRALKEMIGVKSTSDTKVEHQGDADVGRMRVQMPCTPDDPEILRKGIFNVAKRSKPPPSSQRIPTNPVELPKGRLDYGSGFRFGDEGLSETVRTQMSMSVKDEEKNKLSTSSNVNTAAFAHEATLHIQQQLGLVNPSANMLDSSQKNSNSGPDSNVAEISHYSPHSQQALHYIQQPPTAQQQQHMGILNSNASSGAGYPPQSTAPPYTISSNNNRKISPPQQLFSHNIPTASNGATASAGGAVVNSSLGMRPPSNTSSAGGVDSLTANISASQAAQQSAMMHSMTYNQPNATYVSGGNPPVSSITANQQQPMQQPAGQALLYPGAASSQQSTAGMDYQTLLQTIAMWSNMNPQVLQAMLQTYGSAASQGPNASAPGNSTSSVHHHPQQPNNLLLHSSVSAQPAQHNAQSPSGPLLMNQNSGNNVPQQQAPATHNFMMNYQVTSSQQRSAGSNYFTVNSGPPNSGGQYILYPPNHHQQGAVIGDANQNSSNVTPALPPGVDDVTSGGSQVHISREKYTGLKHTYSSPIKPQQQSSSNSSVVNQAHSVQPGAHHGGPVTGIFSSGGPGIDFHHPSSTGYGPSGSNYTHHPGQVTHPYLQPAPFGMPHYVHTDGGNRLIGNSQTKLMPKNFNWMPQSTVTNPNNAGNAPGQTGNAANN